MEKPDWKNLEELVERLFRSMGYETQKNAIIEGKSGAKHEIDVLAIYKAPLHEDKVAIECKHHQNPVNKDVIMKLKQIIDDTSINKGIIVSTSGFTSGAIKLSNQSGIKLMDRHELEKSLEKEGIREYKPLRGKLETGHFIVADNCVLVPTRVTEDNYLVLVLKEWWIKNNSEETLFDPTLHVVLTDDKKNMLAYARWSAPGFMESDYLRLRDLYPRKVVNENGNVVGEGISYNGFKFRIKIPMSIYESRGEKFYLKMVLKSKNRIVEERFVKPEIDHELVKKKYKEAQKRGCFIATSVYGTPQAKELDTLREFRDRILLKEPLGELFTRTYYKISPPIAGLISRAKILRKLVGWTIVFPAVKISKKLLRKIRMN